MKRIEEIDVLKGIGIFLMVFNHVGFGGVLHHYIQSFHMPLFFISSGYLWTEYRGTFDQHIKHKAKKLMLPYFVSGSICLLYWMITSNILGMHERFWDGWLKFLFFPTEGIPHGVPLWFLPSMFVTDIIYTGVRHLCKNLEKAGFIFSSIALIGMLCSCTGLILPWGIEPALTACLFMYLGEYLKRIIIPKYNFTELKASTLFLFTIVSTVLAFINPTVDMRTSRYCIYPLYVLNGGG